MRTTHITRRTAIIGATCALSGCNAVASLNAAARPLDTYDLTPAAGTTSGRRTTRTLLIARPEASAAIATNRIMIKTGRASISYLPDAQWSDELPLVLQNLLIRSISGTDRVGYVGQSDGGPIPDSALLIRLDAFEVRATTDGAFSAIIDMTLTILNDRTQRIVATRRFSQSVAVADDTAASVVNAFQSGLDVLLPDASDWAVQRV